MLGKLLKYEIKAMGRVMLPLYALLIAISTVFALTFRMGVAGNPLVRAFLERFAIITSVLFVVAILMTGIVMAVLIVQRFAKNLLGSEGYLMFTLPVTTAQNILSKGLSSLLWMVVGALAGGVSGLISVWVLADLGTFQEQMQAVLRLIWSIAGDGKQILTVLLLIALILVGTLEMLYKIYAAISLGHLWSDHRALGGVIAYIAFSAAEVLIMRLPLFQGLLDMLSTQMNLDSLVILLVIEAVKLVIYYTVTWFTLERKLNLE